MAITYQFNAKRHNVGKIRSHKRRNARIQKGVYAVNDSGSIPVTDRKIRREEKKRQKKIEKKVRKNEKKNRMQVEEVDSDDAQDMEIE